jgi:hypothetical protein
MITLPPCRTIAAYNSEMKAILRRRAAFCNGLDPSAWIKMGRAGSCQWECTRVRLWHEGNIQRKKRQYPAENPPDAIRKPCPARCVG